MTQASEILKHLTEAAEVDPLDLESQAPGASLGQIDLDQLKYQGIPLFTTVYDNRQVSDAIFAPVADAVPTFDGQECYLGYDPKTDTFYQAFEGSEYVPPEETHDEEGNEYEDDIISSAYVVQFKLDGQKVIGPKIQESYATMFYNDQAFGQFKKQYSDVIDVRLD